MEFELYMDSSGEYRWRLKAANGEIIAVSSEGYTKAESARKGIALVRKSVGAPLEDLTRE